MALLHDRGPAARPTPTVGRSAAADNLKVVLVAGVIVAHATMAWSDLGTWVVREPPVREPLLGVIGLAAGIAALFGLAVFFVLAGLFTPGSLARKGPRRFARDRVVRLGVPIVFFVVLLSPFVEYVDADNVGWTRGFAAFAVEIWWPPAPGPTWFLGILLLFSLVYAAVRTVSPAAPRRCPVRAWQILAAGTAMTVASYLVRMWVPLGEERWRLALGQAPAWVTAFAVGVVAAERGWFDPIAPPLARRARRVVWGTLVACALSFVVVAGSAHGFEAFAGGPTALPLVIAVLETLLVLAMPVWLLDVFRRRFDRQGPIARAASRAAFAAFVLHQIVLVGLVLVSRLVAWPPELEYLTVSALAVLGSFGAGWLVLRVPGVSRVV